MKRLFLFSLFLGLFLIASPVFAQEKIKIDFFFSPTCPHCQEEEKFLDNLQTTHPELQINRRSVFEKENTALLKDFYAKFTVAKENQGLVPITFTEKNYFVGFNEDIGKELEKCISACELEKSYKKTEESSIINLREKISLPIVGEIGLSGLSPLASSIVLGGLDGFNACAMTALAFLLAVLLGTKVRGRVMLIGGVFILVSGLVYFFFITAWLNLFLALEQMRIITYLVGLVIIIFSVFMLKDWFHGIVCKLCRINPGAEEKNIFIKWEKKLFEKMGALSNSKISLGAMILAVAAVAAGVNTVELACSFGFPLAFSKMLVSLGLPSFQYYFYIFVYVLFYMLDDLIIFLMAVLTMRLTKFSDKYLKIIKLISGIVLLLLGIAIMINPKILSFS